MMKALFTPLSIGTGLIAGIAASKIFERIWTAAAKEEAPDPKQHDIQWRRMLAALAVEGAIMRVVRGSVDHGARVAFNRVAGEWPGDKHAEQKSA